MVAVRSSFVELSSVRARRSGSCMLETVRYPCAWSGLYMLELQMSVHPVWVVHA